jgi:uncharacterized ferredoxin-like protein
MSRGLGKVQREIIEILQEHEDEMPVIAIIYELSNRRKRKFNSKDFRNIRKAVCRLEYDSKFPNRKVYIKSVKGKRYEFLGYEKCKFFEERKRYPTSVKMVELI